MRSILDDIAIPHRIGLSATPDRGRDVEGNQAIDSLIRGHLIRFLLIWKKQSRKAFYVATSIFLR